LRICKVPMEIEEPSEDFNAGWADCLLVERWKSNLKSEEQIDICGM